MTRPSVPALLAGASGIMVLFSADVDPELAGGSLTGPMIIGANVAAMLLFAAMLSIIWKPRISFVLSVTSLLLFAPWSSWLLAPGSWCAFLGRCYRADRYPLFTLDWSALAIFAMLGLSIWLQWPRRRP